MSTVISCAAAVTTIPQAAIKKPHQVFNWSTVMRFPHCLTYVEVLVGLKRWVILYSPCSDW